MTGRNACRTIPNVKTTSIFHGLLTLVLRAGLVVALLSTGWVIYSKLPLLPSASPSASSGETTLQIILQPPAGIEALDIAIELYPIDIVAVRHEYFTERR